MAYVGAIVCRRGHEITRWPEHTEGPTDFCSECGSDGVRACESCAAAMPPGDPMNSDWRPPSFCGRCGAPFAWTVSGRASANELIDMLDGLSESDREALKRTLDDLVADSPGTEVAAMRFKLLAKKAGQEGGTALRAIVTSVATEAAKRLILGGP